VGEEGVDLGGVTVVIPRDSVVSRLKTVIPSVSRGIWVGGRCATRAPRSLDTLGMTAMRTSGFNFEQTLVVVQI
jgi:hypothetical protein